MTSNHWSSLLYQTNFHRLWSMIWRHRYESFDNGNDEKNNKISMLISERQRWTRNASISSINSKSVEFVENFSTDHIDTFSVDLKLSQVFFREENNSPRTTQRFRLFFSQWTIVSLDMDQYRVNRHCSLIHWQLIHWTHWSTDTELWLTRWLRWCPDLHGAVSHELMRYLLENNHIESLKGSRKLSQIEWYGSVYSRWVDGIMRSVESLK